MSTEKSEPTETPAKFRIGDWVRIAGGHVSQVYPNESTHPEDTVDYRIWYPSRWYEVEIEGTRTLCKEAFLTPAPSPLFTGWRPEWDVELARLAKARAERGEAPVGFVNVAEMQEKAGKPVRYKTMTEKQGKAAYRCMAKVIRGDKFLSNEEFKRRIGLEDEP